MELRNIFDYREGSLYWKVSLSKKTRVGDIAGYRRKDGYVIIGLMGKVLLAHRLIYEWHHGHCPALIDHKDRDPSNNCIENLRPLSRGHNQVNSSKIKAASGAKGVRHTRHGRFNARITKDGVEVHLGNFSSLIEASDTYEKARHNFFPSVYEEAPYVSRTN